MKTKPALDRPTMLHQYIDWTVFFPNPKENLPDANMKVSNHLPTNSVGPLMNVSSDLRTESTKAPPNVTPHLPTNTMNLSPKVSSHPPTHTMTTPPKVCETTNTMNPLKNFSSHTPMNSTNPLWNRSSHPPTNNTNPLPNISSNLPTHTMNQLPYHSCHPPSNNMNPVPNFPSHPPRNIMNPPPNLSSHPPTNGVNLLPDISSHPHTNSTRRLPECSSYLPNKSTPRTLTTLVLSNESIETSRCFNPNTRQHSPLHLTHEPFETSASPNHMRLPIKRPSGLCFPPTPPPESLNTIFEPMSQRLEHVATGSRSLKETHTETQRKLFKKAHNQLLVSLSQQKPRQQFDKPKLEPRDENRNTSQQCFKNPTPPLDNYPLSYTQTSPGTAHSAQHNSQEVIPDGRRMWRDINKLIEEKFRQTHLEAQSNHDREYWKILSASIQQLCSKPLNNDRYLKYTSDIDNVLRSIRGSCQRPEHSKYNMSVSLQNILSKINSLQNEMRPMLHKCRALESSDPAVKLLCQQTRLDWLKVVLSALSINPFFPEQEMLSSMQESMLEIRRRMAVELKEKLQAVDITKQNLNDSTSAASHHVVDKNVIGSMPENKNDDSSQSSIEESNGQQKSHVTSLRPSIYLSPTISPVVHEQNLARPGTPKDLGQPGTEAETAGPEHQCARIGSPHEGLATLPVHDVRPTSSKSFLARTSLPPDSGFKIVYPTCETFEPKKEVDTFVYESNSHETLNPKMTSPSMFSSFPNTNDGDTALTFLSTQSARGIETSSTDSNQSAMDNAKLPNFLNDLFACPVCSVECESQFCLLGHMTVWHDEVNVVTCRLCCRQIDKVNVFRHLHAYHLTNNNKFVCGGESNGAWKCTFNFESEADLLAHMFLQHRLEPSFDCHRCGYVTSTINELAHHHTTKETCDLKHEADDSHESPRSNMVEQGSQRNLKISIDKAVRTNEAPVLPAILDKMVPVTRAAETLDASRLMGDHIHPSTCEHVSGRYYVKALSETESQPEHKNVGGIKARNRRYTSGGTKGSKSRAIPIKRKQPVDETNAVSTVEFVELSQSQSDLTTQPNAPSNTSSLDLKVAHTKEKDEKIGNGVNQVKDSALQATISGPKHSGICFVCVDCEFKGINLFKFRQHLAQHATDEHRLVQLSPTHRHPKCGICGYFADGEQDFNQHVSGHLSEKCFICTHCLKDFTSVKAVKLHCQKEHPSLEFSLVSRGQIYHKMLHTPQNIVILNPTVRFPKISEEEIMAYTKPSNGITDVRSLKKQSVGKQHHTCAKIRESVKDSMLCDHQRDIQSCRHNKDDKPKATKSYLKIRKKRYKRMIISSDTEDSSEERENEDRTS